MPMFNNKKQMSALAAKPETQKSEAELKAELAKKRLKAGPKGGSR
jgi:hypothetical protein